MKLRVWRIVVVLAVAFSAIVGVYELMAPRVDLADGTVRPVGAWFSIPGRSTATYLVVAEPRGSNLSEAGIAVGDRYSPRDSFAARWLWRPGEHVAVAVHEKRTTRAATLVASGKALRPDPIVWIVRFGRFALQIGMLLLAIIAVWHFADARWTRWLCAFLVLSGFSPWQVDPIEYVGWWRVAAFLIEATATQAAIVTAMIFAVAIGRTPPAGFRHFMVRLAPATFVFLELCIVALLVDARGAYVTAPLRIIQLTCIIATVAALATAARQVTGQERQRLRYMAWTFALGFSGFFLSLAALWSFGNNWGATFQVLSIPRLTLLFIPIGLAYGLLSHRVVSSHYIASRTLVYGAITSSLVPIFAGSEWAAINMFGSGRNAFIAAITIVVAASFKKIQGSANATIERMLFNEQHRTQQALNKFSREVPHISDFTTLAERYVDVLDKRIAPVSTALYASRLGESTRGQSYIRIATAGSPAPAHLRPLDPIAISLEGEGSPIECDTVGDGGHAFPVSVRGHLTGLLLLGALRNGEILSPDQFTQIEKLTQSVGVALEQLRFEEIERRLRRAEIECEAMRRVLTETAVDCCRLVGSQKLASC